jgi:hypothetical protein
MLVTFLVRLRIRRLRRKDLEQGLRIGDLEQGDLEQGYLGNKRLKNRRLKTGDLE